MDDFQLSWIFFFKQAQHRVTFHCVCSFSFFSSDLFSRKRTQLFHTRGAICQRLLPRLLFIVSLCRHSVRGHAAWASFLVGDGSFSSLMNILAAWWSLLLNFQFWVQGSNTHQLSLQRPQFPLGLPYRPPRW